MDITLLHLFHINKEAVPNYLYKGDDNVTYKYYSYTEREFVIGSFKTIKESRFQNYVLTGTITKDYVILHSK